MGKKTNIFAGVGIIAIIALAVVGLFMLAGGSGGTASIVNTFDKGLAPAEQVCTQPINPTLNIRAVNADDTSSEITGNGEYVYEGTDLKNIYIANASVKAGTTYTAYSYKSGYLGGIKQFTTDCIDEAPIATVALKDYDTALSFNVINSDGRTTNTQTANQTLSSDDAKTITFEITPSAKEQHIAGGASNQFSVYINASNDTDWDIGETSLSGENGITCVETTHGKPSALTGTLVKGFDCTGDITGTDTTDMYLYLASSSSVDPTSQMLSFNIVGHDYYQKTANPDKNSLQSGPIKDDKSAIQTLQTQNFYVG